MKIFLDTIDIKEIQKYQYYNLVDGITTNPTLMAKSNQDFFTLSRELCELVQGDVSLEVSAIDYEDMLAEGNKIRDIASNVVIKLPMTWSGLKACEYFSKQNVKVNMTLCFSPIQALMAGRAGAKYISPFIGRLDDIGEDGISLIDDIRTMYDTYNITTNILAASVRSIEHITDAALSGADYVTIPPRLMESLIHHDLTDKGLKQFTQDWNNSGMKI